jgi:hypothetical protein
MRAIHAAVCDTDPDSLTAGASIPKPFDVKAIYTDTPVIFIIYGRGARYRIELKFDSRVIEDISHRRRLPLRTLPMRPWDQPLPHSLPTLCHLLWQLYSSPDLINAELHLLFDRRALRVRGIEDNPRV